MFLFELGLTRRGFEGLTPLASSTSACCPHERAQPDEPLGESRQTAPVDARARTAFVDESFRRAQDGCGLFLLSAVCVPDLHRVDVEQTLRSQLRPNQLRWHFRDERPAARHGFIAAVAGLHVLGAEGFTFWCSTPTQRKAEQARVRCLWGLLAALKASRIDSVVIESRQEHNDRKDRREILGAQRAGVASDRLSYRHARPKGEPLLWLPDALAGAVGMSVADGDHQLLRLLPHAFCGLHRI